MRAQGGPKDGKASGTDNRRERSERLLLVERAQGGPKDGKARCIFIALHGSLWLGKDKGSIMKSVKSGGTIYYKHYYGNKLFE